jgi:hypothetical protein
VRPSGFLNQGRAFSSGPGVFVRSSVMAGLDPMGVRTRRRERRILRFALRRCPYTSVTLKWQMAYPPFSGAMSSGHSLRQIRLDRTIPATTARAGLRRSLSRNRNQVWRDHHAVVPCMSRNTARLVRRARQSGRPGAGGITEQPRRRLHPCEDILPMERNRSPRQYEASRCEASRCIASRCEAPRCKAPRCKASRCELPSAAERPARGLAWAGASVMRRG